MVDVDVDVSVDVNVDVSVDVDVDVSVDVNVGVENGATVQVLRRTLLLEHLVRKRGIFERGRRRHVVRLGRGQDAFRQRRLGRGQETQQLRVVGVGVLRH